jgi:hypothetical protein
MHSAVSPACPDNSRLGSRDRFKRPLDLSLNGPLCGLNLETVKVRAVVLDPGPEPMRLASL